MWLLTDIKSNVFKAISLFSFHFSKNIVQEKAELASSAYLQLIRTAMPAHSFPRRLSPASSLGRLGWNKLCARSEDLGFCTGVPAFTPPAVRSQAIYRREVKGQTCYRVSSPSWLNFRSTCVGFSDAIPRLQGFSRSPTSVNSSLYWQRLAPEIPDLILCPSHFPCASDAIRGFVILHPPSSVRSPFQGTVRISCRHSPCREPPSQSSRYRQGGAAALVQSSSSAVSS